MKRMLMVVGAALAAMSVPAGERDENSPLATRPATRECENRSQGDRERDRLSLKEMREELEEMRYKLRRPVGQLETLEELMPFENAMTLAKVGEGKGYFQLALRYASGNELPKDPKLAYKMLCKARDAGYANAILVEGLCDEASLRTPDGFSDLSCGAIGLSMREYCGVRFSSGQEDCDSLTNEISFARVMGKYEKAKALGALTATNQITALNRRLEDFKSEKAKLDLVKSKADENNKKVLGLLPTSEFESANSTNAVSVCADNKQKADELQVDPQKVAVFLKEYLGVQFGESIEKFPVVVDHRDQRRKIPMVKPYQYFDCAYGTFEDGRLYEVCFYADISKKYSADSVSKREKQSLLDLSASLGASGNVFYVKRGDGWAYSHTIGRYEFSTPGRERRLSWSGAAYRIGGVVKDKDLFAELRQERVNREKTKGEELPGVEEYANVRSAERAAAKARAQERKGGVAREAKLVLADAKVESFLKEYLGVQFGDDIEKFPQTVDRSSRNEDRYRVLPVLKKFRYLDKAIGSFMSGRLISVSFVADIDEKYSEASVEARMEQVYDVLTDLCGVEKDAFSNDWICPHKVENSRYAFARWRRFTILGPSAPKGFRRCGIVIKDIDLESALKKAESEKGEALPEVK